MAFTKTPTGDTYSTKMIPLMYPWDSRNGSTDEFDTKFENALLESIGKEYFQILKRDGSAPSIITVDGAILGIHFYTGNNGPEILVVYMVNGGNVNLSVYNAVTQTLTFGPTGVLTTGQIRPSSPVFFQDFLFDNGFRSVCISVGFRLSIYTDAPVGLTPIPAAPGLVQELAYLDGYLFFNNGTSIVNSNLNDPTTWPAGGFLDVDSYADGVNAIARSGNYIVAMGHGSIQFFYDAANPTGSPLAANVGATKKIGCLGGVAQSGDTIYFVGQEDNGNPALFKCVGLKVEPVVSLPFSRVWDDGNWAQQTNHWSYVPSRGAIMELNGHTVYCVTVPNQYYQGQAFPVTEPALDNSTYIYDLSSEAWSRLKYQQAGNFPINSTMKYQLETSFVTLANQQPFTPTQYFSVQGSGAVGYFSERLFQDSGVNFTMKMQTRPMNFDTHRNKFGSRMLIQGDLTSAQSFLNVDWSDNDYQSFSAARQIDLSIPYQQLYALGVFRQRAFRLTYTDNFPLRLRNIELDYNLGAA